MKLFVSIFLLIAFSPLCLLFFGISVFIFLYLFNIYNKNFGKIKMLGQWVEFCLCSAIHFDLALLHYFHIFYFNTIVSYCSVAERWLMRIHMQEISFLKKVHHEVFLQLLHSASQMTVRGCSSASESTEPDLGFSEQKCVGTWESHHCNWSLCSACATTLPTAGETS